MDTRRSTALAASVAVVAAFALIVGATFSGIPFTTTTLPSVATTPTSTSQTQTQTSLTSSQQSTQQTASQQTASQQSTSEQTPSEQSSSQQGQGTISVLLTDPPSVSSGVTKLYVNYADLEIHASGASNTSGWTTLRSSGSVELLGAVNNSLTISSAKIGAGTYNMIRFDITSAKVVYSGQNTSTFVQTTELTIPIVDDVGVVASATSATIIDMSPTIINVGSQSSPEFIMTSVAEAFPVPSGAVTTQQEQQGAQTTLVGASWWEDIAAMTTPHLKIGAASLNETYLNLQVLNNGGSSTALSLVTITEVPGATEAGQTGALPTALGQSAVFLVLKNGTLVQAAVFPTATSASAISASLFSSSGLELPAGATASLTHSHGDIVLGLMGTSVATNAGKITKGQQYLVTVIGTQVSASIVVTAT